MRVVRGREKRDEDTEEKKKRRKKRKKKRRRVLARQKKSKKRQTKDNEKEMTGKGRKEDRSLFCLMFDTLYYINTIPIVKRRETEGGCNGPTGVSLRQKGSTLIQQKEDLPPFFTSASLSLQLVELDQKCCRLPQSVSSLSTWLLKK